MLARLACVRDNLTYGRAIDISAVLLLAAISTAAYFYFRGIGVDDAYITYRIAQNVANGFGLVYNPGEQVQVSTTPLFTLILSIIGTAYPDISAVGPFVSGIGLFASAAFLYLLTRAILGAIAGIVASVLFVTFPLLLLTLGMETPIYLMFATGSLYFYFRRRLDWAAVFLALTLLTRPDGIILAIVVLAHHTWTSRRLPLRQLALFGAITIPWLVFSQLYFGSVAPATLGAKMAHGQSFWWSRHFLQGAQAWIVDMFQRDAVFALFVPFAMIGFVVASKKDVRFRVLLVWTIAYAVGYTLLRVPDFHWYYAPLLPVIMVATAAGIEWLPRAILFRPSGQQAKKTKIISPLLSLLVLLALVIANARMDFSVSASSPRLRFDIYREAGLWLNENSPAESTIAMVEIGIIGYHAKNKVIDLIGLTHPDTAKQIAASDFTYAIRHYQPDYVVLASSWLAEIQEAPWFGERYFPAKFLENAGFGPEPLVIYRKVDQIRPSPATIPETSFDGKIMVRGYSLEPVVVRTGENLRLTLVLQSLQPVSEELGAFASIVDGNGRAIVQKDLTLRPDKWSEGIINQHFDIYVPPTAKPGKYDVHAGLYYLPNFAVLPVSGTSSQSMRDRLRFNSVKVANRQQVSHPANGLSATLGGKISLLGYDINAGTAAIPKQLELRLYWRTAERMQQDLTVFVHLVDQQGRIVTQHDGQPRAGSYPTSIWDASELVLDEHTLELGDSLPSGDYRIAVGMYYAQTNERLDARSDGAPISENAIVIGSVRLP